MHGPADATAHTESSAKDAWPGMAMREEVRDLRRLEPIGVYVVGVPDHGQEVRYGSDEANFQLDVHDEPVGRTSAVQVRRSVGGSSSKYICISQSRLAV